MITDENDPYEWLRSRPPRVQEMIRRFPEVCRVVATLPLRVPAPGRVGRVVGYYEQHDGFVGLYVEDEEEWLRDLPGRVRAQCDPGWLRVIQYDGNKTPELHDRVLAGENPPITNPGLDGRIEGDAPACPLYGAPCPSPGQCIPACACRGAACS